MFVYEQKSLCVHTDIVDVYHSALWTKKLYNTLLLFFFSNLKLGCLHPSLKTDVKKNNHGNVYCYLYHDEM